MNVSISIFVCVYMNLGLFIRGQGLIIDYAESAATIVTSGDSGVCVGGIACVCVCVVVCVCMCVYVCSLKE